MSNHQPTYKLEKKLSINDDFKDRPENFMKSNAIQEEQPHFFTEQRIEIKPFLVKLHSGQHQQKRKSVKWKNNDLVSINDEESGLAYSSNDHISELSQLMGLGIKRGHSFEKEKIDFSLSSEAYDTEHQNLMLRKKMTQMRKELGFYRQHQESMFGDVLSLKERADNAEGQIITLKHELQAAMMKITEYQKEQMAQQQRIEQLQRLLAHNQKDPKEIMVNGLQEQSNYNQMILRKHEDQIEELKQHYEKELFQNSIKFRKIIEEMNHKFDNSKTIGQNQINELIAKLMERDEEIKGLKRRGGNTLGLGTKVSTLISDHQDTIKSKSKDPLPVDKNQHKYMNRFLQFSQFIDERIQKSLSKQKLPKGRISKSAIDKEVIVHKNLQKLEINMPESPTHVNCFKISELLQKNERLRTPKNIPQKTF